MRRKYLSLILAAVISLGQIAGTGQLVQASEVSGEIGQEVLEGTQLEGETPGETGQQPETGEETGQQPPTETTGEMGQESGNLSEEGAEQQPGGTLPPSGTEQGNYTPNFYVSDEFRWLPGEETTIYKVGSGNWNGENGTTIPMEIAEVVSADSEVVSVENNEELGGWILRAKGFGETTVTVTGKALQDVSGDNASEAPEKQIRVIVSDKTYGLVVEGMTQNALPGAEVNLTAKVTGRDMNWQEADVSDAVVVWTAKSDVEGILEQSERGNNFQIHIPDIPEGRDSYWITVTAEVKRGEETVSYLWLSTIFVNNLYYKMEIEAPTEIGEMWPGETRTITPVLYRYETGKEPEAELMAMFQFAYSEENIEIQKDGVRVEPDVPQSKGDFTIKRLKNRIDPIQIFAYLDGNQQGGEVLQFQWKDYNDISIEGGYYVNLFVDDDNPEESDTEKEFTLDTSKLGGDYEIEWKLENDEVSVDPGVYKISGEKGESITIDAKALRDDLKRKLGEDDIFEGGYSCQLIVVVKAEGTEQAMRSLSIAITKPDSWISEREYLTLKGTALTYKDGKIACFVQNKDHPTATELMLELKEVKILEETPEVKNTKVFTVKKNGEDILLVAENYGEATIEYRVAYGGREKVFTIDKAVVKDKYEFSAFSSTGTTHLLPGAELKMETEVWHGFYNENAGKKEWEKLDPGKYTIKYTGYDKNLISVEADGTVKAIGENGYSGLGVFCTIPIEGEEDDEYVDEVEIQVSDSYAQAFAEEIFAAPGETVDYLTLSWKSFDLEHKNGMEVEGNFAYQFLEKKKKGVSFNEAKTAFTVNDDAIEGSKIRIRMRAEKENSYGQKNYALGTVTVNIIGSNPCSHNFIQKSLKPATCTEPGIRTLECSICHAATKTETIPAAGHKAGGFTTVKEATCTEAGSQQQKCTVCGKVMHTKDLSKTGHSFGNWEETAKPTALKQGTETRTCKTCKAAETRETDKLKASIKLNVKKIPLQVKKSTTAVKVVSMTEGDGIKSWKSSNTKVATVTSKGKITGKKEGSAKITVTLKSGISASVTVKVQKKAVTTTKLSVTGNSVKKNKLTLKKGKSVTLIAVKTPVTSPEKITYQSSNKKIAAVTSKGKVTGKKPGKAKITVKSGKKKVTISVTVKKK